ncbi:hypothetical protein HWV62_21958 [Athelia sp. TMB]|nr:hypothetical protein HWV62_21958 [Athelia sp. TMB]
MLLSTLATVALLIASAVTSPTPVLEARAANPTIYMRIEGPTKTIYEKTIVPSPKASLTNNGHTAKCNGPKSAPGVTSLVALQETGQFFESTWTGKTFGQITKLNGTTNNANNQWAALINNINSDGLGAVIQQDPGDGSVFPSFQPDKWHFLFAFFGDIYDAQFLILSGPKTASVGQTVQYKVPYAPDGTYVNDLSVDTTTGQKVYAQFGANTGLDSTVGIKFTKKGTYNMKAHCPSGTGSYCIRSNHVVTVVS